MITTPHPRSLPQLSQAIKQWGLDLGFQQVGITDIELGKYSTRFQDWLGKKFHGAMDYMGKHGAKRTRPEDLIPGTLRVISVRMDYLTQDHSQHLEVLQNPHKAYVARYALGRDYHKLMRKRLEKLAQKITAVIPHHYRVFCDSAPVLEKPLAEKAGLGFIGKNTNLINTKSGSWFFLGEIYTDIALSVDPPQPRHHCGSCHACIDVCPTQAIVAPFQLDARKCISYLTIEWRGPIPEALRPLMGNRIYGCDDCQLFCPWNKFAQFSAEDDFQPRHQLDQADLLTLFAWSETEFVQHTQGSAIKRIGYECWLRNIAVALGNAPYAEAIVNALQTRSQHPSVLVREHVNWALARQIEKM
jgi:epoxyqueuosine reductase